MSSSKSIAIAAAALFASVAAAGAAEVCPLRYGKPALTVEVFDGSPEDLAMLMPEATGKKTSYWELAYVYEAGRTVTIRCKYRKGDPVDVPFPQKIERCDFKLDKHDVPSITCK